MEFKEGGERGQRGLNDCEGEMLLMMEKGDEFNNGEWWSRVCGRRFALARSQSAPLRSRLDRQTFSKADASSFLS